jgi:hypothetical protein
MREVTCHQAIAELDDAVDTVLVALIGGAAARPYPLHLRLIATDCLQP